MNPQTNELLQQLAAKLGVTAQYLWAVLVRGNRIEGAILWVFVLCGVGLLIAAYKVLRWVKTDDDAEPEWAFLGAGLALFGIILVGACFYWAVMGTFCPEYGALADILSHLK